MVNKQVMALLALMTLIGGSLGKKADYEAIVAENAKNPKGWKAGLNPMFNYDDEKHLKSFISQIAPDPAPPRLLLSREEEERILQTATSLDLRAKYPACPSHGRILNQGACGSCWAFGTSMAVTDRWCAKKGSERTFSPGDLTTCCLTCSGNTNGCNGGYLNRAMDYIKNTGLATGTNKETLSLCKPYFIPTGNYSITVAPACSGTTCTTTTAGVSNLRQKITGWTSFSTVTTMMSQLSTNGSITSMFAVYADFYTYVSGVYTSNHVTLKGYHAIRIIGYGKDATTGKNFWLIANSWGTGWGEKGFFRMIRGVNNCGMETTYASYGATI